MDTNELTETPPAAVVVHTPPKRPARRNPAGKPKLSGSAARLAAAAAEVERMATAQRRELLRDALLSSIELLRQRRASDIPEGFIDDYVALNWLEWHGGGLRITTVGENICKQITSRRACA